MLSEEKLSPVLPGWLDEGMIWDPQQPQSPLEVSVSVLSSIILALHHPLQNPQMRAVACLPKIQASSICPLLTPTSPLGL